MMTYDNIDQTINTWTSIHDLVLLEEDTTPHRRYCYTSSEKGETFQIVIEPERDNAVRIDAHLIETFGSEEAHYIWEVPTNRLKLTLDTCLMSVRLWFDR